MCFKNLLKMTVCILIATSFIGVGRYSSARVALQSSTMELTLLETLEDPNYPVDIAWSYDAEFLASIDHTGIATVRSAINWNILTTFDCGPGYERLAWSPNQSVLAIGCHLDSPMIIETINSELTIVKLNSEYDSPSWSEDGSQIAVPQHDGTITILNSSFQLLMTLGEPIPPDPIYGIIKVNYYSFSWSPSNDYLASFEELQAHGITLWDLDTQEPIYDFTDAVDILWLQDGNTFTVTIQNETASIGAVQTWTLSPLQMVTEVSIPYGIGTTIVEGAAPTQYLTFCEAGEPLSLYDTATSQHVTLIAPSPEMISCPIADVAWSANSLLAIARGKVISIWGINLPTACDTTQNHHGCHYLQ